MFFLALQPISRITEGRVNLRYVQVVYNGGDGKNRETFPCIPENRETFVVYGILDRLRNLPISAKEYTGFQVRCPTYFTHAFKRAGNANRFGRMCEFK